jgi:hypothetical protein
MIIQNSISFSAEHNPAKDKPNTLIRFKTLWPWTGLLIQLKAA